MRDVADNENHDWKPTPGAPRTGNGYLDLDYDATDVRQFKAPLAGREHQSHGQCGSNTAWRNVAKT
jgi:hypothetical protein